MASGTLDQIIANHPGRIAAVDVHYPSGNHFYLPEATNRIQYYPPPYFGNYIPPWLWYDGNQHGEMDFSTWEPKIAARLAQPSPVAIDLDGNYSAADDSGTVCATIRNDSTGAISGRVLIVITEDNLFYSAPNGVMIHNNVPRDFIPTDTGTTITIAPGDSVLVTQSFTTNASWADANLNLVAWIQDDVMQADSTKEIWQGSVVKLVEVGIADHGNKTVDTRTNMQLQPNPVKDRGTVSYQTPFSGTVNIALYDVAGKLVKSIVSGEQAAGFHHVDLNLRSLAAGVYLVRLNYGSQTEITKLIITE